MDITTWRAPSLVFAALASVALFSATQRSLWMRVTSIKYYDKATFERIKEALAAIEETYRTYRPQEVALAFNGGKDCLIVFQLVKAFCERHDVPFPFLVYFEREDEFPEMLDFMWEHLRSNRLSIHVAKGGFKQGLADLRGANGIKAVLMGQRRSDPYAPQAVFAPTTEGWPEMMRVNPILDLTYAGVWTFLKATKTKYCGLYDQGYTSLGPKSKTKPNSKLSSDGLNHRPAHELEGGDNDERAGRNGHSQAVN
jgi:FAD synthetase